MFSILEQFKETEQIENVENKPTQYGRSDNVSEVWVWDIEEELKKLENKKRQLESRVYS